MTIVKPMIGQLKRNLSIKKKKTIVIEKIAVKRRVPLEYFLGKTVFKVFFFFMVKLVSSDYHI